MNDIRMKEYSKPTANCDIKNKKDKSTMCMN